MFEDLERSFGEGGLKEEGAESAKEKGLLEAGVSPGERKDD